MRSSYPSAPSYRSTAAPSPRPGPSLYSASSSALGSALGLGPSLGASLGASSFGQSLGPASSSYSLGASSLGQSLAPSSSYAPAASSYAQSLGASSSSYGVSLGGSSYASSPYGSAQSDSRYGSRTAPTDRNDTTSHAALLDRYRKKDEKPDDSRAGPSYTSQFLKQRAQQLEECGLAPKKTSEVDSPLARSSSYLARKTSLADDSYKPLDRYGGEGGRKTSFDSFGLGGSRVSPDKALDYRSPFDRKDERRSSGVEKEEAGQQDYMSRLLAAHNRVDDLLRSRGMSGEDERKYLRAWEEIPTLREVRDEVRERYVPRVRHVSSSSDSGLSTDSDHDASSADPSVAPQADEDDETEKESQEATPQPDELVEEEEEEQEEETTDYCEELWSDESLAEEVVYSHPLVLRQRVEFACRAADERTRREPTPEVTVTTKHDLRRKPQSLRTQRTFAQRTVSVPLTVAFSASASTNIKATVSKLFAQKPQVRLVEKVLPVNNKEEKVKKAVRAIERPKEKPVKPEKVDIPSQEEQRTVLAKLQAKKAAPVKSAAEISIQHCSFYQVNSPPGIKEPKPEKHVRINLRLTERAPNKAGANVSLPAPPKVVYARLDVIPRLKPKRALSQAIPHPPRMQVGKLDRSRTAMLQPPEERKISQREIKPLKIPDHFLQTAAQKKEDIAQARNHLRRAAPMDKKRRHPPERGLLQQLGERLLGFDRAVAPSGRARHQPAKNANRPLVRAATTSEAGTAGAARRTRRPPSPIAYSDVDRILIEQFRRRLHIPKPAAIHRMGSPCRSLKVFLDRRRVARSPSPAPFLLSRPSPERHSPCHTPRCASPTPPKVVRSRHRVTHSKVHPHRINSTTWGVVLKPAHLRDLPATNRLCSRTHAKKPWVPKWRMVEQRSEEEVEEVEEEEVEEEVEEEEEEAEEEEAEEEEEKPTEEPKVAVKAVDDGNLNEAEKAMQAAKKRSDDEAQAKLMDYEERRRNEREKEEEELRKLKEKQEKRRQEREEEEREQAQRRIAEEERRKLEEEERKARQDAANKKREEEKIKRAALMGGGFTQGQGGRNFVIPEKKNDAGDKFGNIVQAKQEMGMTKEQQEEAKKNFLATISKGIEMGSMSDAEKKAKIKELHQRICRLEMDKYDLEKRHERQTYDLKELNERQRQVARNAAGKKGMEPGEENSRHPPKKCISSKYDRQIDRRNFKERRAMFENKNAYPCFPNIPPPPALYEKIIKANEGDEGEGVAEEEYE